MGSAGHPLLPICLYLTALADVLGTDMQLLLSGEIDKNEMEKGNMNKLRVFCFAANAEISLRRG